ncbi:MAG: hypothetical protein J3Q66DRAFT_365071 [Benniella sp.]|nr:MAG: hypothetical protein J3Q66DRAFT_365071 [Benniella sp.]
MSQAPNFIAFHDLSPEAHFLWVSSSVYDVLGYEAGELVGRCGYDIVYPDDFSEGKEYHKDSFINDMVAFQIIIRYKAKDGRPVHCLCVISICYDFVVSSATVLDQTAEALNRHIAASPWMFLNSGAPLIQKRNGEFERMKRHHQAFAANTWDHQLMEPEARVCLILNRFTRSFIVIYASSACEKVFHMDPDDITGKPILLYIRADDLAPFVEQVNLIKSSTAIAQMRFWFQSPNWPQEIPCEAIILGAADGIVAVVRRCKPFVRKHLIGSREQFDVRNQGSFRWNQPFGSSPCSDVSASSSYGSYGIKSATPPRNVTRATLNRIKILELDEERALPISTLLADANMRKHFAETSGFKEVIVQHYEEEDDNDGDVDAVVRGVAISTLGDGDVGI